jgi:hypothetical protein
VRGLSGIAAGHVPSLDGVHLLYIDEAGKSGARDFTQPYYVLGGMIVHESKWQAIEADLNARIDALVPRGERDHMWELHMAYLFHGKAQFKRMPRATRYALVDAVFDVLDTHQPVLIMVAIHKQRHLAKYGRAAQPVEEVAYRFMLERFNMYVGRQDDQLGVVVADEQKEVELATRKAHSRYRRSGTGWATIDHVIETPFYTPSHWSRMLQIVDVATYWVGKTATAGDHGGPNPAYWARVEPHLDCYPDYMGKGLKIFP